MSTLAICALMIGVPTALLFAIGLTLEAMAKRGQW